MRKDRIFRDGTKTVYHKQTDPNPVLDSAAELRSHGTVLPMGDSVHVGRLDAHVLEMWAKEAGIRFDDREGIKALIRRKLMDSDNAAFRVWEGTF